MGQLGRRVDTQGPSSVAAARRLMGPGGICLQSRRATSDTWGVVPKHEATRKRCSLFMTRDSDGVPILSGRALDNRLRRFAAIINENVSGVTDAMVGDTLRQILAHGTAQQRRSFIEIIARAVAAPRGRPKQDPSAWRTTEIAETAALLREHFKEGFDLWRDARKRNDYNSSPEIVAERLVGSGTYTPSEAAAIVQSKSLANAVYIFLCDECHVPLGAARQAVCRHKKLKKAFGSAATIPIAHRSHLFRHARASLTGHIV